MDVRVLAQRVKADMMLVFLRIDVAKQTARLEHLLGIEALIAEHQHPMVGEGAIEALDHGALDGGGQIDAKDLRAGLFGKWGDGDVGDLHVGPRILDFAAGSETPKWRRRPLVWPLGDRNRMRPAPPSQR